MGEVRFGLRCGGRASGGVARVRNGRGKPKPRCKQRAEQIPKLRLHLLDTVAATGRVLRSERSATYSPTETASTENVLYEEV